MPQQIPVTIVTGLPGSGKAELLHRILSEAHGRRIALVRACVVHRISAVDQPGRTKVSPA
ncbi:GTP-binding protein [Undibacterium arcticum]|uniref:GTP-binding protein n=1 Tax=Undibacterium arcticum TaxID=1762892 RepID=A0ABV7F2Y6_9BURK